MTAPMQAGTLRRKLTIQQRPASQDAYGFNSVDASAWTTVLTTWGHIQVRQGSAMMAAQAGQIMPVETFIITLRYPPSIAILAGMRVLDGSNTYVVQNVVDVDERHRTLTLYATMVPAPGA